jgi:hypothetical protein
MYQVLYLDSLDISTFALPPDKLPRISLFDLVLLKRMINADQENNISYCNSDSSTAGCTNVRVDCIFSKFKLVHEMHDRNRKIIAGRKCEEESSL